MLVFDNFLFRCSSLGGKLMTYPDKDELSKTPRSYLDQIFKEHLYGVTNQIQSRYIEKGIMVEQESIELYSRVTGKKFEKNDERFDNHFITGEPDIIGDELIDIKSSWSHSTFPFTESDVPNKDYYWQMQGYMALTNKDTSKLVYCLVDTPDELIHHELKSIRSKLGVIELPEELEEEIWNSMRFASIKEQYRIKEFVIERNQDDIDKIYRRVEIARDYLNNLTDLLI